MLFVLNVILGTLNLIPIPPLDGSRVVGGFLPRATYKRWAELDRYGNYVFMGLFLRDGRGAAVLRRDVRRRAGPVQQRSCRAGDRDRRRTSSGESATASAGSRGRPAA